MKLFKGQNSKRSNYRFKDIYSFKISDESINRESLILPSSNYNMNSNIYSFDDTHEISSLDNELMLNESKQESSVSFGYVLQNALNSQNNQPIHNQVLLNKLNETKKLNYSRISSNDSKTKKFAYNKGRWTEDEHRRFLEAILKYGNDWKRIQSCVKTRSGTQTRSHSQKFFLKLNTFNLLNFKDSQPSLSTLTAMTKKLSQSQRENLLNMIISYEYNDLVENNNLSEKAPFDNKNQDSEFSIEIILDNDINTKDNSVDSYSNYPIYHKIHTEDSEINNEKEEDDFKDEFFNTFVNKRMRKQSFEDNLLFLYSDSIIYQSGNEDIYNRNL